jgi:hypothetical protein
MKNLIFLIVIFISTTAKGWYVAKSDNYENVVKEAKQQLIEKLISPVAKEYFKTQLGKDTSVVKSFLRDEEPQVVHLIYKETKNEEYLVIFTNEAEKMGILLNGDLDMTTVGISTNCQFDYLGPAFKFDNPYLQATFGKIPRYIEAHLLNDYVFRPELIFIREQNVYNRPNWFNYRNDKIYEKRRLYEQNVEIIVNSTQEGLRN